MASRRSLLIGGVVAVGAVVTGVAVFGRDSLREWLGKNYTRTSASGDYVEYTSPDSPDAVVADITRRWSPLDRTFGSSFTGLGDGGTYLLYDEAIVAVLAAAAAGSLIQIDSREGGWARWGSSARLASTWRPPSQGGMRGGGSGDGGK